MKLAFLGDIHGNLPALDAVLDDLRQRSVDQIFHLGNVVGYGPQPREVIRKLQDEGIEGVRGNHDERVVTGAPILVGQVEDDSVGLAESACDWTREQLDNSERDWLERLPFIKTLSSGRMKVALFHASPVTMDSMPHSGQPDDFYREMGAYTRTHVNVFAHTHVPFYRVVDGRWYVNAGSVGFSRDGDERISCAVVELNGGAAVHIVRLPSETSTVGDSLRANGLPSGLLRLFGIS